MVHIYQRDNVAVLMVIQSKSNFVKQQLDVGFGGLLIHCFIESDL
jgi:hypothetical protein